MTGAYARLCCAFSFLTRLRLPGTSRVSFSPEVLTGSVVWYPVVGLFYSLVSLGLWQLGRLLRLDPTLTAFALLAAPFLLNRFLHFDGLCDVLDAFLADKSPGQRLEIMKDSRNGSFALGGACLSLLLKYLVLLGLVGQGGLLAVLLAPPLLRGLAVAMAFRARYPRPQGTAFNLVGRISSGQLLACLVLVALVWTGLGAGIILAGPPAIGTAAAASAGAPASLPQAAPGGDPAALMAAGAGFPLVAALAWTFWLRRSAGRKIGGVTGDVLGCLIEGGETLFLAAALVGPGLLDALLAAAGQPAGALR